MNIKNKIYIGVGLFALILEITNPSVNEFKAYAKKNERTGEYLYTRRWNFLLFSIFYKEGQMGYNRGEFDNAGRNYTYLGIVGNLFLVREEEPDTH